MSAEERITQDELEVIWYGGVVMYEYTCSKTI